MTGPATGPARTRPGGWLGQAPHPTGPGGAGPSGRRTLVVYLTVGDPLTEGPPPLGPVLARAGVDVLELGLPTPSTSPRGTEVAESFRRAGPVPLERTWRRIRALRASVGAVPMVVLAYPQTISDIGWAALLSSCRAVGIDGIVLTEPSVDGLEKISGAGLGAIPLIRPGLDRELTDRWERHSSGLVYRTLGGRTGERIDAAAAARRVAAEATTPFWAGFGISSARDIAVLVPSVTGVVIGSELLRRLRGVDGAARPALAAELAAGWRAATVPRTAAGSVPEPRLGHHGPGGSP